MKTKHSCIIHDHRKIGIQLEYLMSKDMAAHGFTAVQAYILLHVLDHPEGTSLTALCQELGSSMSSLSCMIKRLKNNGYIHVEHHPDDDRCKLLFGTQKGFDARQTLEQTIQNSLNNIFHDFSQDELKNLEHIQKKILNNLSDYAKNNRSEVL